MIKHHELDERLEAFTITSELRFAIMDIGNYQKQVLQQAFQGDKGTVEWRNVPIVKIRRSEWDGKT